MEGQSQRDGSKSETDRLRAEGGVYTDSVSQQSGSNVQLISSDDKGSKEEKKERTRQCVINL